MKHLFRVLMALLIVLLPASGFAEHRYGRDYRCDDCGTVRDVERIKSRDAHLGAGTVIGAIAGGVLGSTIGKGSGRRAATVGGALVGGAVGHDVEKHDRGSNIVWRYRIKMDNGEWISVVRRHGLDVYRGDRVRVVGDDIEIL